MGFGASGRRPRPVPTSTREADGTGAQGDGLRRRWPPAPLDSKRRGRTGLSPGGLPPPLGREAGRPARSHSPPAPRVHCPWGRTGRPSASPPGARTSGGTQESATLSEDGRPPLACTRAAHPPPESRGRCSRRPWSGRTGCAAPSVYLPPHPVLSGRPCITMRVGLEKLEALLGAEVEGLPVEACHRCCLHFYHLSAHCVTCRHHVRSE